MADHQHAEMKVCKLLHVFRVRLVRLIEIRILTIMWFTVLYPVVTLLLSKNEENIFHISLTTMRYFPNHKAFWQILVCDVISGIHNNDKSI